MKRIRFLILFFIIALLPNACELSHNIDIELPKGESYPLIEAYLTKGESMKILLFNSNTLQESVKLDLIWNASVYIICDGDSLKLKNLIKVDESRSYVYNYILDTLVSNETTEFSLYIEKEGLRDISGECRTVGDICIENLELDSTIVELQSRNLATASSNYYQLRMHGYAEGELKNVYQMEYDFHEMNEGPILIKHPLESLAYDSLGIDLYRLDSTAYVYCRSISNAQSANKDPYSTPVSFAGNVADSWGIFTCVSRDSRMIYFY